ncbi:MAG: glycerol dehydrogenase [Halanaerobiales bacterium]
MPRILISPGKYIQGKGVLKEIGNFLDELGERVFIIIDPVVQDLFQDQVKKGLKGKEFIFESFGGECSKNEINRLKEKVKEENSDIIVGIGGGKTLDTAKAVAYYSELPVGVAPTIAATDAPCSSLSVIYTEAGVFEEYLFLPSNPDLVLVDSKIVAQAPVKFLVAGMGDALATYFEADACSKTRAENIAGGSQTEAALNLAYLCYQNLLEYGLQAKKAVEVGAVTEAVEKIIESNTLLSGLGFESGGLAAAHAIHNGLTELKEVHDKTHGEKVAFATIVQLFLEERAPSTLHEVIHFCERIGLPTTLAELGVEEITEAKIRKVAEASCVEDETIHNLPFAVDADMVYDAILAVDNFNR